MVLTREGEEVVKCAKKMLGLYQSLQRDLQDSKRLISHLTIGVTHTAESNPIAEALANYCAQNDHVMIKMITGTIKNLYSKLKSYAGSYTHLDVYKRQPVCTSGARSSAR